MNKKKKNIIIDNSNNLNDILEDNDKTENVDIYLKFKNKTIKKNKKKIIENDKINY